MQRRKSGITNLEIPLMRIQAVRQATLEVTGSSRVRVHCDVVLSFQHNANYSRTYRPRGLVHRCRLGTSWPCRHAKAISLCALMRGIRAAKGWVVHPLKSHMSWVQYVARQYGSISWECSPLRERILEYERNGDPAPLVYRL
jgi:hypothetical protein